MKHISTGDLVRNSNDEEIKKIVASGSFVSDSQILKLLKKAIKEEDLESGIIFDGFPRTVSQAPKLDSLLGKMGVGLNYAIFLDVSEDIAKKRIARRAEKENRKDDSDPKIVEKRFDEYKEKTQEGIVGVEGGEVVSFGSAAFRAVDAMSKKAQQSHGAQGREGML
jgi:adenylate kinase